jgi:hypothetical protein
MESWLRGRKRCGNPMASTEPEPSATEHRPLLQFSLRTLLLLCVVLGSSLAVFGGWGVAVFVLVVGLAGLLRWASDLRPLIYLAFVLAGLALWLESINDVGPRYRPQCLNRLHQVAVALHNYRQAHGCFPPAYIADKDGKPTQSWRVLILPYMDNDALYKACDVTQPWDAPKNKKLLAKYMPDFVCPIDPSANATGATQTNYFAVVGPNAAWAGAKSRKLADFGKDASRTIMVVEVANSGIQWAEPEDLSLDTLGATGGSPRSLALTSDHGRRDDFFFVYDHVPGISVALADGSVRFLRTGNRSPDDLRRILQIGGYNDVEISLDENFESVRHPNWPNIAALLVWLLSVGTLLVGAVRSRKRLSVAPTPAG